MNTSKTNTTGSFCCVCNGTCNHVGPHSYCEHHSPKHQTPIMMGVPILGYGIGMETKMNELIKEVKELREEIKKLKGKTK